MKYFALLLTLGTSIGYAATATTSYILLPIVEVYDGDTIKTEFVKLPPPLNKVEIRIRGIDTPEMPAASYPTTGKLGHSSCIKEAEMAIKARDAVIALIEKAKVTKMRIENFEYDKYGGRILADVKIKDINIAQYLIDNKLAIPYQGEKKTHDWCS